MRAFDQSGNVLQTSDLTVNFTNAQGRLAGIKNGAVPIYIEGKSNFLGGTYVRLEALGGEDDLYLYAPNVTAMKTSDGVPPSDGLAVVKGDSVTLQTFYFSLNPLNVLTNDPKWYRQQLQADGTWTAWEECKFHASGSSITFNTDKSGIFRTKAVYLGQDGLTAYHTRKTDEGYGTGRYGFGKRGQLDTYGVADTASQIAAREETKSYLGNTDYELSDVVLASYGFPSYPSGSLKCNIFVAHRATAAGEIVPKINGILSGYPPLANQWAGVENCTPTGIMGLRLGNFSNRIDHWPLLETNTPPQPGFLVAHPAPGDSGHTGIVDYDGYGIGAGSGSGTVNKNFDEFLDGTSLYRVYQP